ncbi:hypothetical protein EIN_359410 [Entamoeba invadens IP1]|uniref:Uncharacterized protein n=1 Tax=Entamoeba invadens IP1 TaxID=370355 RepID=A0A0A1U7L5_ENTIV|nr:hypothetical protein EIN_359410 [Entamoeba invadens IP1]ELP90858.1 hypothetical protein EIN_359410 [Entamoeba invadens IP1]|eukprot:XP_004257629.1 hypothetical protein EIN_359410 [Entamoeba invadens IP1]
MSKESDTIDQTTHLDDCYLNIFKTPSPDKNSAFECYLKVKKEQKLVENLAIHSIDHFVVPKIGEVDFPMNLVCHVVPIGEFGKMNISDFHEIWVRLGRFAKTISEIKSLLPIVFNKSTQIGNSIEKKYSSNITSVMYIYEQKVQQFREYFPMSRTTLHFPANYTYNGLMPNWDDSEGNLSPYIAKLREVDTVWKFLGNWDLTWNEPYNVAYQKALLKKIEEEKAYFKAVVSVDDWMLICFKYCTKIIVENALKSERDINLIQPSEIKNDDIPITVALIRKFEGCVYSHIKCQNVQMNVVLEKDGEYGVFAAWLCAKCIESLPESTVSIGKEVQQTPKNTKKSGLLIALGRETDKGFNGFLILRSMYITTKKKHLI